MRNYKRRTQASSRGRGRAPFFNGKKTSRLKTPSLLHKLLSGRLSFFVMGVKKNQKKTFPLDSFTANALPSVRPVNQTPPNANMTALNALCHGARGSRQQRGLFLFRCSDPSQSRGVEGRSRGGCKTEKKEAATRLHVIKVGCAKHLLVVCIGLDDTAHPIRATGIEVV